MTSGGLSEAQMKARGELPEIHPERLFIVSCIALTSGAMMFAIMGDIRLALKHEFVLTNADVGWLAAAGSGFTVAIFALGPLCDAIGMKWLLRLAFFLQLAGAATMVLAEGFGTLFLGALVNALGSGAIEAVCNPLIATIYPDKKTQKLSQFHMWFPGGIVIGGVACYLMTQAGLDLWRVKVGLVLLPTLAYGLLFIGQDFPVTERVQSGISFKGMIRETFARPLFLVLLACMLLTASLELGPQGWIPAVLQAGGMPGILVLVWVTGLMAVGRYFAGPVVRVLTNTGVLVLSAVVAGVGLFLLSIPAGTAAVIGFAAVFAIGVCYFWPTMLGTVAERIPKGGALALAIIGGTGGLFVNVVTTPTMGWIADQYLYRELVFKGAVDGKEVDRADKTLAVIRDIRTTYEDWGRALKDTPQDRIKRKEISAVIDATDKVLKRYEEAGKLPHDDTGMVDRIVTAAFTWTDTRAVSRPDTAAALRVAIRNGPPDSKGDVPEAEEDARLARAAAERILNPADNKGGLMSFRFVSPVALVLVVVFGILLLKDRRRGGYRPEKIGR